MNIELWTEILKEKRETVANLQARQDRLSMRATTMRSKMSYSISEARREVEGVERMFEARGINHREI